MRNKNHMLIAFIPPKKVINNLAKIREMAEINVKKDSGLKQPHITIIDDSFSNIGEVDKILRKLSKTFTPFKTKVKGLDTFEVKKSFGIQRYENKNSLIYSIKKTREMINLRNSVVKNLMFLKTRDRLNQWIKENPNLSKKKLSNIKKYGTPFSSREWKFHVTIGLIPRENQREILEKIKSLNLTNEFEINQVGLFKRENGWKLYKKYKFK